MRRRSTCACRARIGPGVTWPKAKRRARGGRRPARNAGAPEPRRPEDAQASPLADRTPGLRHARARPLGFDRARRRHRLSRRATAADRPARRAEAAAQHRHPGERRHAPRQPRRDRRRAPSRSRNCRPICPRRSSPSRTGASTTISASIRSASPRAIVRNLTRRGVVAGRLDADAAARQEPVPDPGAHRLAQDPGGDPGALAGAQVHQGPDPRTLPQPGLFRRRRLRRRGGGAALFRQARHARDARGSRDAGRPRQAPSRLAPEPQPEAAQARADSCSRPCASRASSPPSMAQDGARAPGRRRARRRARARPTTPPTGSWTCSTTSSARSTSDIVVATTIDPSLQAAAERAARRRAERQGREVQRQPGRARRHAAGRRRAGAGRRAQLRRRASSTAPTAAKRQPGSAFKPFVYLAALERGLTPDTVRDDAPVNVNGWSPENYSQRYRGPVALRDGAGAVAQHRRRAARPGGRPEAVVQTAQRLGITSPLQANASIALGTSEVTPLETRRRLRGLRQWRHRASSPTSSTQVKTRRRQGALPAHGAAASAASSIRSIVGMMNAMMHETLRDRHGAQGAAAGLAQRPARPAPARISATPGSSATRATSSPASGSAMTTASRPRRCTGGNLPVEVWSRS